MIECKNGCAKCGDSNKIYDERQKTYPRDLKIELLCTSVRRIIETKTSMFNQHYTNTMADEVCAKIKDTLCTETE